MPSPRDSLHIPKEYDRRVKLDDSDRVKIVKLRNEDSTRWSYQALADEFGVSKRLIIFICKPETLKKARKQFKERRKDGRYYDKDKWRGQMRKHRAWKKELDKEGKLIK